MLTQNLTLLVLVYIKQICNDFACFSFVAMDTHSIYIFRSTFLIISVVPYKLNKRVITKVCAFYELRHSEGERCE